MPWSDEPGGGLDRITDFAAFDRIGVVQVLLLVKQASSVALAALIALGLLPAHGFWLLLLVSVAHAARPS